MKYTKNVTIWLCYGAMSLAFFLLESYSAFLFLFSISAELILLIAFYVFYQMRSKQKSTVNYMNVVYGAVPLLFLNTFLFAAAGLGLDGNEFYELNQYAPLVRPIVFYKWEISTMLIAIIVGYFFEYQSKKKTENKSDRMEFNLVINGVMVWGMGIFTIIVLNLVPTKGYPVVVSLLPVLRALIEIPFYWGNRVKASTRF
ncbi:MAG: hypothetical protein HYZ14_01220 [Bacteroidetes bacterium]|nr:hypothetical protein [Bacteroidota bacterium]